jgi:hypothetical protein
MPPIFLGIVLGAGAAFLLDPQQGRRRRALMRDRMARTGREAREFGDAAAKDLRARAHGFSSQLRSAGQAFGGGRHGEPPSDDVLVERVRAKLGRYVSHPHAIRVSAQNSYVTVSGDILASEHGKLLQALRMVPGVRDCADRLDVHTSAEGISALQGGTTPSGQPLEILQSRWSPGTRAIVGGAGALLSLYALARGGARGVAALAGGAALIARAKANRPLLSASRPPLQGRVVDRQPERHAAVSG